MFESIMNDRDFCEISLAGSERLSRSDAGRDPAAVRKRARGVSMVER